MYYKSTLIKIDNWSGASSSLDTRSKTLRYAHKQARTFPFQLCVSIPQIVLVHSWNYLNDNKQEILAGTRFEPLHIFDTREHVLAP